MIVLAATEASDVAERVVNVALAAGIIAFLAAVGMMIYELVVEAGVRSAAKRTSKDLQKKAADVADDSPIKAHGGLDSSINAIANLAKTMKDLDRSARLLIISLAFFAVAVAGAIGNAVTDDDDGDNSSSESSAVILTADVDAPPAP